MNKKFTKLIAALALLVFMTPSLAGWGQTTVASYSRSGTTNTITGGTFSTTFSAKTDFYQDATGDCYMQILNTDAYWTTTPTSISFAASIGGGTGNKDLTNPVYVSLLDANGDVITNTQTTVTSHITTNTGDSYVITMPVVNNVYGVKLSHEKETGYNVRYYSFSLSYVANGGSTPPTPTTYTVTFDAGEGEFVGSTDFPNESNTIAAGTYTLPSATPATGYTFNKWNIGDATYDAGASYTVSGNADFVASYTQNGGGTGETTTTYTFTSKSWAATPTDWTSGQDGNQFQSGRGVQVTNGATGANATSPKSFTNVSSIVVTYSTNASKGKGAIKVQIGNNTEKSVNITPVGTDDHTATFTFAPYETGSIKLTVDCTENSIYIKSIAITETAGGSSLDPSDLAITGAPVALSFDLYNNSSAQTVSYTTSSTGAITIEPASPTTYFSYVHNATNKTITVTPLAVTPSAQTVTISQAADDDYYAGTATFTVSVANSAPLANIAALTANTTAGNYVVTLNNAVVTYVNGSNAYIQDASGAVQMHKNEHGLTAGDVLNGTATVGFTFYNGNPQITSLSGVTPVSGTAPDPTSVAQSAWNYTFNDVLSQYFQITGATITKNNNKYYVSLGGESIQLYKQGTTLSDLDLTKTYTIVGFPTLYNSTKELTIYEDPEAPKTDPTITFNNGTVRVGQTLDLSTLFTSNSNGDVTYSITAGDSYATLSGSELTGTAEGSVTVKASQAETTSYNAGEATATITVNPALVLSSIAVTTAPTKTIYNAGETFDPTGMVVTATYTDNSTEAVTGYTYLPDGALATTDTEITISYTENNVTKTTSQAITVNEVVDYATLPFVWAGGTKDDLTALNGVSASGLGSHYAESNYPYRVKFDTDGDWILIKTNEQPAVVRVDVKKLGGAGDSSIKIQGSSDGSTFTDVETFDNEGTTNAVLTHITSNAFAVTDRYVKILFVKPSNGSNVGVGSITIRGIETYSAPEVVGYGDENEDSKLGYRLIASPVTVDPEDVVGMTTGKFDLYWFDQTQDLEWQNYEATGGQFDLLPGMGYLYAHNTNVTLTFTGVPYVGDGVIPLTQGTGKWANWNLVGNPFGVAAYIDQDYYEMNPYGNDFITGEANDLIDAMQGVFVVYDADPEHTVTTVNFSVPSTNTNTNVVPAPSAVSKMSLNISRNRGPVIDRAIVRFNEGGLLPKFQLNPNNTKIYITEGNQDYAIVRSSSEAEVPVSFKAAENGTYTLSIETKDVEMSYLHLIDNMTGADVDLLATPSYSFEARTTDYASRFRLVFSANNGSNENGNETFAYYNGSEWVISNMGEATLQVVDVMGRVLSSETVSGNANVSLNQTPGVYMLRLVNSDSVKTQKIVVR